MDILGKVKELVELIFQKDNQDITVKPSSIATYTAATTVELPNDASTTQELANTSGAQTLTNKDINADTNTISELETDNLKSGVLNTSTTLAGASDTQVPSALATKTYVDDAIATKDEASEISYDNTTSGLTATDVQAAIDEVDAQVDTNTSDISTNATNLTNHEADTSTHGVTEILGSSEAQAVTNKTVVVANNTITTAASGNLISTELNAALAELQTDIDTRATDSDLTTHENDTANPHSVTATQVGLGSVDNTSDLDKPISTATQTALDLKADESITVTGDESGTTGGGDLTANRTISIRDNPVIPGTAKVSLPSGTTAQRPGTPANNLLRHNSDTNELERYNGTEWTGVGGGGLTRREASVDPNPAIIDSDYIITGAFGTFTLPAIGGDGEILYLKRGAASDFDGTPMTITPDGADTVGGDATLVWDDADVDLIILTSNGTDWELTTTISPSAVIGVEQETETKVLDNGLNGTVRFSKIGNQVIITSGGPVTHGSSSSYSTSSGFIPEKYRPTATVGNLSMIGIGLGYLTRIIVNSDGTLNFAYADNSFTSTSQTGTGEAISISYNIV